MDLEVLRSLDRNLVKETITGHNILGWLIQIVHTECSSSMNYSWVCDVLQGDYFPDSMKEGLRDICECLKITECGLLDERGKVSWEEKEEMKSSSPENGKTKNETCGGEGTQGEVLLGKAAVLEQGNETDGTLASA